MTGVPSANLLEIGDLDHRMAQLDDFCRRMRWTLGGIDARQLIGLIGS